MVAGRTLGEPQGLLEQESGWRKGEEERGEGREERRRGEEGERREEEGSEGMRGMNSDKNTKNGWFSYM